MARIRIFVLVCVFSAGLLAAAFLTAPVNAAVFPSETPTPVHIFLPLVMRAAQDATPNPLLSLTNFVSSVTDPSSVGLKGIYVPAAFAYRVVAQPAGNYTFVSSAANTVTEFGLTSAGVTGLLGHETLAGKAFSTLQPNQEIYLVWADGSTRKFTIASAHHYQALSPRSPSSDFIDMDSGVQISAADLFVAYYMGNAHVTLQTCIAKNGDLNWGRLFVVAVPAD